MLIQNAVGLENSLVKNLSKIAVIDTRGINYKLSAFRRLKEFLISWTESDKLMDESGN